MENFDPQFDPRDQFHRNPRFMKTMMVIGIAAVILGSFILMYSSHVDEELVSSKRQYIEAGLMLYHKKYNRYPQSLEELVSEGFMNRIPPKSETETFEYSVLNGGEGYRVE